MRANASFGRLRQVPAERSAPLAVGLLALSIDLAPRGIVHLFDHRILVHLAGHLIGASWWADKEETAEAPRAKVASRIGS